MSLFDFFKKKNTTTREDYTSAILAAIEAFGEDDGNSEWGKALIDAITQKIGGDKALAFDLFRFLPIAFARFMLPEVQFADHYQTRAADGSFQNHTLLENRLYAEIVAVLNKTPLSEPQMHGLIAYNSEIQAINEALHKGSQLEDLVMSAPMFT